MILKGQCVRIVLQKDKPARIIFDLDTDPRNSETLFKLHETKGEAVFLQINKVQPNFPWPEDAEKRS